MLLWCYFCSQNSVTIKMKSDKKPWTSKALLLVLDDEDMLSVILGTEWSLVGGGGGGYLKGIQKVTDFMAGFFCVPV